MVVASRRSKQRHGFIVKPAWAEVTLIGMIVALILGFVAILNSYPIPDAKLKRIYEAKGLIVPEGFVQYQWPADFGVDPYFGRCRHDHDWSETRFGRYIYAIGGNPDAAELSGINTRWMTVKNLCFAGLPCGLAALVAQARLQSHGNDIGTLDELKVIAATVIGGTALAGGIGTIYGAILGR